MAYTTVAKVKSMFRGLDIEADTGDESTSTAITTEETDEFISEADAEIDAKLFDYYEVPVTGVQSLIIVGQISKLKVSQTITNILQAKMEFSDKEQDVQINLGRKADKMLTDIIPTFDVKSGRWTEPRIQLSDAVRKPTSPKTASIFSSSVENEPVIIKGGDNW